MKKLALLLALCLVLSMLPVAGLTEVTDDILPLEGDFTVTSSEEAAEESVLPSEGLLLIQQEDFVEVPMDDVSPMEDGDGEAQVAMAEEPLANVAEFELNAPDEAAQPTPHIDPEGPQLSSNEITLGVGEEFSLNPTLPTGKSQEIYMVSDDESVAQVSEDGTVTAIAVGDTVVSATIEGGVYTECFVHVKKAPNKVSLNFSNLKLGKGEKYSGLTVTLGSKAGKYAGAYTFSSDNAKVVTVDAQGTLKAVKTGKTKIRVKTYNGKKAECKVTVVSAPGKITATTDKGTLGVDERGAVSATLPKNTASQISYKSENPEILEVDAATGETHGLAVGKTRVCVSTFNNKKTYVDVTVAPAPEELTFDDDITLSVGMKLPIAAQLNEGAAGEITYSVEDKSVASYSKGELKGVSKGETVLVAKTYNGLTAQCDVEVFSAPKSVKLPYKTLNIGVKQSLQLVPDVGKSVSTFSYTTSNKRYVKVDANGMLTGVKQGSATITIKTFNKKNFNLKVKVVKAPGSISLSTDALELGIEESATLDYTLPKNTAGSVTFTSSDDFIATVDEETGEVTGVSPGTAVITATTHNGKKATATVTVFAAPEWVKLSSDIMALAEKQSMALEVELSPGSRSPLKFSSKNKKIAKVSSDGVVTGVGEGQTTITVKTNVPGVEAFVDVTVLPAPRKLKLATKKLTLNVGETTQMEPIITEGAYTVFTYTSSNEAVATVSEDGMVETHAKGKAELTVKTHNGLSATLKLTVLDPWFPDAVTLVNAPDYMKVGESLPLEYVVEPEGAIADLTWASSNESVALVDENGVLHALGYGYATITATSARNSDIKLTFTLGVETDYVVLTIPARTTNVSDIDKNLKKIYAIHASALRQLEMLRDGGIISSSDAAKRKTIIDNAFKDYAFPWMTLNKQPYWRAANSEGGAKDFKTDRVYYGIPYTQNNRGYNAARELKENRFYDSGKGYYVMNQKSFKGRAYYGNDCSTFVNAAIWGTNNKRSNDRTGQIAKDSAYKTISDYGAMRTGDLICRGGSHVVMFLYYVNAEKTKIMIIENGGIEAGTNTVHCMVMDVKWYTSRSYKIRRLKSLG